MHKEYLNEIWKDIKGYEGFFLVSNLGRVRSVDRHIVYKNGKKHYYKGKILKPYRKNNGYVTIELNKNGVSRNYYIHRLVAEAFIPNPNNYPCVNHKNNNRSDNVVWVNDDGTVDIENSNLEWCSYEYNNIYGDRIDKMKNTIGYKTILQYDLNGNFLYEWESSAELTLFYNKKLSWCSNIYSCCIGKRKSAYGYVWKYKSL